MKKTVTMLGAVILLSCESPEKNTTMESSINSASTPTDSAAFKSGHADVNGIKLYYEIHGEGQPLVLLHGGGSTLFTSFGKMIPLLAKDRQVIAVELQAHGRSTDRPAPESFEQDADDVAGLLKALNIGKTDIMGFSNGGSTSLQVAIRHPECVNRIVAVSAIYKRSGMPEGFFDFMQKGTISDMPQVYKDAFLSVTPDQEKLQNMFSKDRQRMLDFKDWSDDVMKTIKAPVLVVVGDRDVVSVEHALAMTRLLPNARLAVLPGGHGDFIGEAMSPDPQSKTPALVANMIEEFLKSPVAH